MFILFLVVLGFTQYSWRTTGRSNGSVLSTEIGNPVINAIHDDERSNNNNVTSSVKRKLFSNPIKKLLSNSKTNGKGQQQYEMVPTLSLKNAFTIEGDDDEEAGFGDDEQDN